MINKKYFYLYRITNKVNNKVYVGCHETDNLNDGYLGSGKAIKLAIKKYGIDNFKKEIISFHSSRAEMFEAEKIVVNREFISRVDTYNLAEGGHGGFKGTECYKNADRSRKISKTAKGRLSVKDKNGTVYRLYKDDPMFETIELVGTTKGKATVKDSNGLVLKVDIDDPRIASGELVGITKGLRLMKDANGKRYQVEANDPRIASGELVGNTKGYVQTKESNKKRSESQKGISKPQRYASCTVCKKTTSITNLIRWHYTRCFTNQDIV